MNEHKALVIRCSLEGSSYHENFVASLRAAHLAATWPIFESVKASALASTLRHGLAHFIFRQLRSQGLGETLLLATTSAEIAHLLGAPALEKGQDAPPPQRLCP